MRYSEKPSILIFQSLDIEDSVPKHDTYGDGRKYPGDEDLEEEFQNYVLWNAAAIVSDANRRVDGIGGHISTYASSSTLYEVGFNHVFRGKMRG